MAESQPGEPYSASNPESTHGDQARWLLLASILRPQGRKGEVLAELYSDFPERFDGQPRVFLAKPGFAGTAEQARAVTVASFFLPLGRNLGRIVLHFAGIDSIEEASALGGLEVIVPHEERLEPEEEASYISDLLGCMVYDIAQDGSAKPVGTVDDVQFPATPDGGRRIAEAAPLLIVMSPTAGEVLIPYVKAYLVRLDLPTKRIEMMLPQGLVEVNL